VWWWWWVVRGGDNDDDDDVDDDDDDDDIGLLTLHPLMQCSLTQREGAPEGDTRNLRREGYNWCVL